MITQRVINAAHSTDSDSATTSSCFLRDRTFHNVFSCNEERNSFLLVWAENEIEFTAGCEPCVL